MMTHILFINDRGEKESRDMAPATDFLFVRHGETDLNADGDKIRGWMDAPLNANGKKAAVNVAKRLKKEKIDAIYTSDLSRAEETAAQISQATKIPYQVTYKLRPWNLGKFTGQHSADVHKIIMEYVIKNPDQPVDGGESFDTFKDRFLGEISEIKQNHPGQRVVVVAHHRNDKLLRAWDAEGYPANFHIDPSMMAEKGIEPGDYREFTI